MPTPTNIPITPGTGINLDAVQVTVGSVPVARELICIADSTSPTAIVSVKDASTQAVATDGSQVVQINPNQPNLTIPLNVSTPVIDNTVLDNVSDNTPGAGNIYTTTGYQRLSFQFTGVWSAEIVVQGSNDNTNWFNLLTYNTTDGSATDSISIPGIYTVSVSTIYMRYFMNGLNGTVIAIVVGKVTPQEESALVAQSFDEFSGVRQQINIASGLAKDVNGALINSDAPISMQIKGAVGSSIIIDTQGYQTLSITTQTMTASVFGSNDQVSWGSIYGVIVGTQQVSNTNIVANTTMAFPCLARYIKFAVSTSGTATVYLRNQAYPVGYASFQALPNNQSSNIAQIGGSATASTGVVGTMGVGGVTTIGNTPVIAPNLIGAVDSANKARAVTVDSSGRINSNVGGVDQTGVNRSLGGISPAYENITTLAVTELSQFEGQSFIELLAQILVELKISNYYMYNLPGLLSTGTTNSIADEPAAIRNEPSVLT